jgi:hypothetical protein
MAAYGWLSKIEDVLNVDKTGFAIGLIASTNTVVSGVKRRGDPAGAVR